MSTTTTTPKPSLEPLPSSRDELVSELTRAGCTVRGNRTNCPHPDHDDPNPSASIFLGGDGKWRVKCQSRGCVFSGGDKPGGDVYDLRAMLTGRPLAEVLKETHTPGSATPPRKPSPAKKRTTYASLDAAKAVVIRLSDHDQPSAIYEYQDAESVLAAQVLRWDFTNADGSPGKDFRPISLTPEGWIIGALTDNRPLYNLPEILARSTEMVFIVEGEKAADAAIEHGVLATTSQGGSNALKKTDWTPLSGRDIAIMPDNDDSGTKYKTGVLAELAKLNPQPRVKIVILPNLPPKGDIVDFIAMRDGDPNGVIDELYDMADQAEDDAHADDKPTQADASDDDQQPPTPITEPSRTPVQDDATLLDLDLYRVPGFINDVITLTEDVAAYTSPGLAFVGALSLLSFLTGQKVSDAGGLRTNLFTLALAPSASGKDFPRKVNSTILYRGGLLDHLVSSFASYESIEDALGTTPAILAQIDEFDSLLNSVRKSQDGRHEAIAKGLMTIYTSAGGHFQKRRKANGGGGGSIHDPHLAIFGTAIPAHFYGALSEGMLTNGLVGRMLIIQCGYRGPGKEAKIIRPPDSIMEAVEWWSSFKPGGAGDTDLVPRVIPADAEGQTILTTNKLEIENLYTLAQVDGDECACAVWGRSDATARKLALLYACSVNRFDPVIDADAARWGTRFAQAQARQMLAMIEQHVADGAFESTCLSVIRKLKAAPDRTLPHQTLLRKMKMKAKDFNELMGTLLVREDVKSEVLDGDGRPATYYRLARGSKVK